MNPPQTLYLGAAWYPEHWPEDRWPLDLALMQAAKMNVVRIGDYAWSRLEPSEGNYQIDWMARAVALAEKHNIRVVIATPTDAPPAWMSQKYPDILRVEPDGRPATHGGRRHFNPLSPRYREFSAKIAAVLADKFGKHPNVIGWQIGNEFFRHSCDELSQRLFQQWLKKKYGTLDELNRRWTTAYWSQEYSDWSQILIPIGWQNPCLDLEFFRFRSEAFRDFQQVQINAIRPRSSDRQWITHNMHGTEDVDFTTIMEHADIASWDPYPGTNKIDHYKFGWISDFCRTMKPRPHWIMEAQSQHTNWSPPNLSMPRGALRAMMWHFFAHGAEALLFWQWRSALGGQEQYHGTIIAPDGTPRAHYAELAETGAELQKLSPLLAGKPAPASVAVIYSYINQTVVHRQRHQPQFDPQQHMVQYYGALRAMALNVDVISPTGSFNQYRLLAAPHLHCLDELLIDKLIEYVQAGGHLLLGARSGFKDEVGALLPSRQPGARLSELLGAYVEEHHTLDQAVDISGTIGSGHATIWAEYFAPVATDVEVLLTYGKFNGWIDGKPAMVSRRVGRGRISYLGTWLEPEAMKQVMEWATRVSEVAVDFPRPPEHVEVCCRTIDGSDFFILMNHGGEVEHISLPKPMKDALRVCELTSTIHLPAYGVAVMVTAALSLAR